MVPHIFTRASVLTKLESGPVGPYLPDLVETLHAQRYATHTIQKYLHAADAFGRWLAARRIPLADVHEARLAQYVASLGRRKVGPAAHERLPHEAVGLKHLLTVLRHRGVIAPPVLSGPATPTEQFLMDYDHYLDRVHGAALTTRRKYLYFARQLLVSVFPAGELEWEALRAETLTRFVQQETACRRGFGRKSPGAAVRIFLRYLVTRGLVPAGLEAAVPGMRVWTHASLPEHLSSEEVSRLLTTVSADGTAMGRRNYALLLLLARLGLRALEAARLRLDDVDWRTGVVVLRARKTHRERVLPLPEDVGQALLAYLRHGRPATPCRELFLEHTAPYHPLQTASAITKVVKRLLPKAGIARRSSGAHLFRHTVATQMVRRGASFKAVADVLGHQSLQTTGLYAKLDLAALAQVALPWPGGAQ
jgi:site-specific recombinase XerD